MLLVCGVFSPPLRRIPAERDGWVNKDHRILLATTNYSYFTEDSPTDHPRARYTLDTQVHRVSGDGMGRKLGMWFFTARRQAD